MWFGSNIDFHVHEDWACSQLQRRVYQGYEYVFLHKQKTSAKYIYVVLATRRLLINLMVRYVAVYLHHVNRACFTTTIWVVWDIPIAYCSSRFSNKRSRSTTIISYLWSDFATSFIHSVLLSWAILMPGFQGPISLVALETVYPARRPGLLVTTTLWDTGRIHRHNNLHLIDLFLFFHCSPKSSIPTGALRIAIKNL